MVWKLFGYYATRVFQKHTKLAIIPQLPILYVYIYIYCIFPIYLLLSPLFEHYDGSKFKMRFQGVQRNSCILGRLDLRKALLSGGGELRLCVAPFKR